MPKLWDIHRVKDMTTLVKVHATKNPLRTKI
jgi:hypothetical protein